VSKSLASKPRNRTVSKGSRRSRSTDDYVSVAIAFAEDAIEDSRHKTHGKWLRLAAKRFISDLKTAQKKRPKFYFSPGWANRACGFIEQLPHVEGVWETPNITLHPSHVFFVVNLFGFRTQDGTRRFTNALFAVARKNAKSTLASGILLACMCLEDETGAQVISAATTGSQARIIFNVAKRMVEMTEDLRDAFDVESFANNIVRYSIGANFKPINSKASTQDGLNPSHVALDEIHAHKTHELLNVLRSAAGARKSPLFLYTTTEGYESPGPWAELRHMAFSILSKTVEADHFLAIYFAVDDEDSDFDELAWQKANPLWDVNPMLMTEIRKLAIEARTMPGALAEFRIKRLNRRASSALGWTNLSKWRACSEGFELEQLEGETCWAGFDGAATTDMAAWRLLWLVDDCYYTWGRFWVPRDAVTQRTERKSVNYSGWVEQGLVSACEGATNDYAAIKRDVLADIRRFNPRIIAYDPWNASQFVNELIEEGVDAATPDEPHGLMQFIQGPRSYTPAMKLCEAAYLNGKLRHGGDPVLTWHMANVVPSYDSNMNVKPNKMRSPDKIDGACALFMAFGCAALQQPDDASAFFASLAQ
jgi:phage terminase large subunit-like protein